VTRLQALDQEEENRRADLLAQCARMAVAVEDFHQSVEYDRPVTSVNLTRRLDALKESEHIWHSAKLARLNSEAEMRKLARNRRLA
jgi:hypothetical protein